MPTSRARPSPADFPTRNQYQTAQVGEDGFLARLNTNGSGNASLIYSTYLGGGDIDTAYGVATDGSLNAFVTGQTLSTDFPILNQYQTDQPLADAFVTRINTAATGNASLAYSTYLGGNDQDWATAIATDGQGNAYVTGRAKTRAISPCGTSTRVSPIPPPMRSSQS